MEDPSDLQKYLGCVHHVTQKKVKGETITEIVFDMVNYFQASVDQYLSVAKEPLGRASTPFAPRLEKDEQDKLLSEPGYLADHAASLVMKLMYGVRMAGPHLAVAVTRLSSQITKWTRDSDRRLHRIFAYLNDQKGISLKGSLSSADRDSMKILAWPDADFAGDFMTSKSTSGFFLEVGGLDGRSMPITWGSKKQGWTAGHTSDAETNSLATCMRSEVMPIQHLLETLMRRPVDAEIFEDNEATITSVRKGYSPALRHLPRTLCVSLGFMHEAITVDPPGKGKIRLSKIETTRHKGDLFTKELELWKFKAAVEMINMA